MLLTSNNLRIAEGGKKKRHTDLLQAFICKTSEKFWYI